MIFFFLSSGLFLGWSLGANDAANIFGTAVGTKMIRFKVAAIIASIFVTLGAVIGGAGASHTLGKLGAVNALAGAFMVAFSAGFTVFIMTKYKLPVSTSQAIVGSIIGWNFFASMLTDTNSLTKIVLTWILCPVLSGIIAITLYEIVKWGRNKIPINLFTEDFWTRFWLITVGAFGAYSLGANNIANVMGVFIYAEPFDSINFFGIFTLSGTQILFLIGGLAISAGIITYSHKVMDTVGASLLRLSPITALIVVLAESIVLFIFSSEGLESWLVSHGLPPIPLVPVSSSQAVVGAVVGIGLVKSRHQIRLKVLGEIATGWVTTPIIAGVITFIFLFFLQNVFHQEVYEKSKYKITDNIAKYLEKKEIWDNDLEKLIGAEYESELAFYTDVSNETDLPKKSVLEIIAAAKINEIWIDPVILSTKLDTVWLNNKENETLRFLADKRYDYSWEFYQELQSLGECWQFKPNTVSNKQYNKSLQAKSHYLIELFSINK